MWLRGMYTAYVKKEAWTLHKRAMEQVRQTRMLTYRSLQARGAEKGQGSSLLRTQEGGTQDARRREEERDHRR